MERKIGEIFEDRGYWYQYLESSSCHCDYCDFGESGDCDIIACMSGERKDDKEVHFKKLKKVGNPYLAHDHSRNKDVVVQDYKLYNQHACYNGHEEMLSFGLYGRNEIVTIKSKEPIKSLNCENSVEIQIKQNKEDMEQEIEYFGDENAKCFNSESIEKNLKPFNLDAAKQGKPVCTRDGSKARIICFDRKDNTPIVALIERVDGIEILECVHNDGKCFHYDTSDNDLMMLPEKKEGWVNIYALNTCYSSKEEAEANIDQDYEHEYVRTVKINWEE